MVLPAATRGESEGSGEDRLEGRAEMGIWFEVMKMEWLGASYMHASWYILVLLGSSARRVATGEGPRMVLKVGERVSKETGLSWGAMARGGVLVGVCW